MNPTPRLRFIERSKKISTDTYGNDICIQIRILQQWWAYDLNYPMTRGEWRDVPLEKE